VKKFGMSGILLFLMSAQWLLAQGLAPLKLVQKYTIPADVKGHFDPAIDLQGKRLFLPLKLSTLYYSSM
jgi:hypothetical protein